MFFFFGFYTFQLNIVPKMFTRAERIEEDSMNRFFVDDKNAGLYLYEKIK